MMANYMIVRQRVTDLTRIQTTFGRLKPDREAAGLCDLGQFCAADESRGARRDKAFAIDPLELAPAC